MGWLTFSKQWRNKSRFIPRLEWTTPSHCPVFAYCKWSKTEWWEDLETKLEWDYICHMHIWWLIPVLRNIIGECKTRWGKHEQAMQRVGKSVTLYSQSWASYTWEIIVVNALNSLPRMERYHTMESFVLLKQLQYRRQQTRDILWYSFVLWW